RLPVLLVCLVSCARPRAPRSRLFPYTSLFRSLRGGLVVGVSGLVVLDRAGARAGGHSEARAGVRAGAGAREGDRAGACANTGPRDRKSTRLNSSHDQISYAVFCLKKKTSKTST